MRINYAKNEAIDFSIQRKRGDDLSAHSFRSCLSSNSHSAPSELVVRCTLRSEPFSFEANYSTATTITTTTC